MPCRSGSPHGVRGALYARLAACPARGATASATSAANNNAFFITTSILLLVDFRERLARDAERVDAGRHAAVDRDGEEDLANLIARDAVGQRALHVHFQLVRTIEGADHREVEHAARLLREPLASPARAPA